MTRDKISIAPEAGTAIGTSVPPSSSTATGPVCPDSDTVG